MSTGQLVNARAQIGPGLRTLSAVYGIGGLAVSLAVMATVPVSDAVTLPIAPAGVDGRYLGILLWTVVCLLTSSLGLVEDGRVAIGFATGPLIAAAALGGPAAVAFVALVGTFELRELRGDLPGYGVLANHGMMALAWTSAALGMAALRAVVGAAPGSLAGFGLLMLFAVVGEGLNMLFAGVYVQARTGRPLAAAMGLPLAALTLLLASETTLAWLVVVAYIGLAWWSPLLFIVSDVAAARSLAQHRAGWQSRHHPLTELPNGLGLREHTAELRREASSGVCALYVDLDGFKAINDDFGSDVGDDVLRIIGQRLAAACRDRDFLAHLHGDEFVLLAAGVRDDAEAAAVARRLVKAIEPPIAHAVGGLQVSATVGFQIVSDLDSVDVAIRGADHEMQDAKRAKAAAAGRTRRR